MLSLKPTFDLFWAVRFNDGGGGRGNGLRDALAVTLVRGTGSRRDGWDSRCSWVESTRFGAALSSTFRDGPAAGLGRCTCTVESRSLGQDGVLSTFRPW